MDRMRVRERGPILELRTWPLFQRPLMHHAGHLQDNTVYLRRREIASRMDSPHVVGWA